MLDEAVSRFFEAKGISGRNPVEETRPSEVRTANGAVGQNRRVYWQRRRRQKLDAFASRSSCLIESDLLERPPGGP